MDDDDDDDDDNDDHDDGDGDDDDDDAHGVNGGRSHEIQPPEKKAVQWKLGMEKPST